VTGPDYGRFWNHKLVEAVMRIAGDGTGDTRWKVPGLLDWSTMTHNPFVKVTKDTTTLYASDRDVFLFLVDDTHPIEAGRLSNGDPDLYFRGLYCWNSEVGSKTLGIARFFLRAVCMNRNIWVRKASRRSVSGIPSSPGIGSRIRPPALARFADSSAGPFVSGIRAARERIVARSDEDRDTFLRRRGFSKGETAKIIATVLGEEGHPPASVLCRDQHNTLYAEWRVMPSGPLIPALFGGKPPDLLGIIMVLLSQRQEMTNDVQPAPLTFAARFRRC